MVAEGKCRLVGICSLGCDVSMHFSVVDVLIRNPMVIALGLLQFHKVFCEHVEGDSVRMCSTRSAPLSLPLCCITERRQQNDAVPVVGVHFDFRMHLPACYSPTVLLSDTQYPTLVLGSGGGLTPVCSIQYRT